MRTISLDIGDRWLDRCRDYGLRCVESYENGGKALSKGIAEKMERDHGAARIDRDPKVQTWSKVAEVGYCLAYSLDPTKELNWSDRTDDGYDLHHREFDRRIDIKASDGFNKRFLIWPVAKVFLFEQKKFDDLVFAKVVGSVVTLSGRMSKSDFREKHIVASEDHILITGTWFLPEEELDDMPRSREETNA